MAGLDVEVQSVVDPEADKTTKLPSKLVDADQATTDGGRGHLGDVDGNEVGGAADTDTGEDTTGVDGTETVFGAGGKHDSGTDGEEKREEDESILAAEVVTCGVTEEGTEKGTGLVDGDDVGLDISQAGGGVRGELELLCEGRKGNGSSDEGRVVANHHGSKGSDSGEGVDAPVVDGGRRRPVLDLGEETHGEWSVCCASG